MVELRSSEQQVGRDRQLADEQLAAAREALIAALEAEAGTGPAKQALVEAQAEADAPWDELLEARWRRTQRGAQDVVEFIRGNLDQLVREMVPAAREAQSALVEALRRVPATAGRWMEIARAWERLSKVVVGPAARHPEHHLDPLLQSIRRVFDADVPVPAPLPGLNPAPDPTIKTGG